MTWFCTLPSPIGELTVTSDGEALTGLYLPQCRYGPANTDGWKRDEAARPFDDVAKQLDAWFAGRLTEFHLNLRPAGTPFQQEVWRCLCSIPYGATATYGEVAGLTGRPSASRAVGLANARNPIALVVPCHRVIGSGGRLTGYGGGLPLKQALIQFEAEVRMYGPTQFACRWPNLTAET
ncbi:MAG: methylated-DNA--[protein]-cysteine S-methyltransferase [Armatimonadetes bacterium]|nr:methylated-DNA--[protein]-cysteine S-methyltransferase [Armatimonadota bacterium]MDE2208085.1 methylated-DNA--[protein]-cysteine S-methyltransferase [Armatimonadota bacterium]